MRKPVTLSGEEESANEKLAAGARNAVVTCLNVRQGEKAVLIFDRESQTIAHHFQQQLERAGAQWNAFLLEAEAPRPLTHMPESILTALATANVSIFAARALPGELTARMEMMQVVNHHGIRHAHMVNISEKIMRQGMQADFREIDALSTALWKRLQGVKTIRVTTPAGTDLRVQLSPQLRWVKTSGIISPQKWGNLPGGEVFTSPAKVDGRLVVDGVVGDYLCEKYGILSHTPLILDIKNSRIQHIQSVHEDLAQEFATYVTTDENSNRVGEFAFGTNLAVTELIGEILQDEKRPGIHVAFGHPYGEHTGQSWTSRTHIDCVIQEASVWLDEVKIMTAGKFHREELDWVSGSFAEVDGK